MITFAVCDDDPLMMRQLSRRLSSYMERRQSPFRITEFADGAALLESGGSFDLILLDIRMHRPDGMETARQLRRQGCRSLLIFVTVLRECVFDAFAVQAFDYLIKPLDDARFTQVMDRALRALERQPEKPLLIRRQGNACQVIPPSQIAYCEVLGRKIYLHRRDGGTVEFYGRLHTLEQQLDGRFFRCHRSYLVNLDAIRECGAGLALLSQGSQIPVSRLRERDLAQALLRHIREREL